METDFFESTTTSTVLSWVLATPVFLALIVKSIEMLFEKYDEVPKAYMIYIILIIIILSPFRYLLLQIIAAGSYVVQSWRAFFSCLLLGLYVPIVFGILYAIGVTLPLLFTHWVTGLKKPENFSKPRLFIAALLTPLLYLLGSYLFFLILPLAAKSTHWLKAEDVIRASNGPTWFYYKYACTWLLPIDAPQYGAELNDTKAIYRNHIASTYLSEKEKMRFIRYAYPDYYEKLPNRTYSNIEHFIKSLDYANEATKFINQGQSYELVSDDDIKKCIDLYRKALTEAKFVDVDKLNAHHPNFGNHFRDEYLQGLQLLIDSYDKHQDQDFINAQLLLNKWGVWYSANLDNIKNGNKIEVKPNEITM
jgi:hypothetical protein